MRYHDNEDAGDLSMMNAADASEFMGDREDHELCDQCGGVGTLLGPLGERVHLRCRQCGWQWSFIGCPDCGEPGERKGHMGCQYPED